MNRSHFTEVGLYLQLHSTNILRKLYEHRQFVAKSMGELMRFFNVSAKSTFSAGYLFAFFI